MAFLLRSRHQIHLIATVDTSMSGICSLRHDTGCQRNMSPCPERQHIVLEACGRKDVTHITSENWALSLCCAELAAWSFPCRFALVTRPHRSVLFSYAWELEGYVVFEKRLRQCSMPASRAHWFMARRFDGAHGPNSKV